MSIAPSKRKVQPYNANSCIQALNQLAQSPNSSHPYSMLMQIVRKNIPVSSEFQTPSKGKKNVTQVRFTPSTNENSSIKSCNNISTKLSILKTKNQVRQKKIQQLTQEITKLTQHRVKVSNFKMQILTSIQQISQIKILYSQKNQELRQIRQLITQIKQQQLKTQRQTLKVSQSVNCMQYKIKQNEQNLRHLQQKSNAIAYAVQSQTKKNKALSAKLLQLQNQFKSDKFINKFAKELFSIMVLMCQIKNSEYLNKNIIGANKKNRDKKRSQLKNQEIFIDLCLKDSFIVQKLPINLIILCLIYMILQSKKIQRAYLNKVSFFCNEVQEIFQYQNFYKIVQLYYKEKLFQNEKAKSNFDMRYNESDEEMMIEQNIQNQLSSARSIIQAYQTSTYPLKRDSYFVILHVSTSCPCGKHFEKIGQLQFYLNKFFNALITQKKYCQGCTKMTLIQNRKQINKMEKNCVKPSQQKFSTKIENLLELQNQNIDKNYHQFNEGDDNLV